MYPFEILKRNRAYIAFAALLVLLGLLIGIGFREPFQQFMESQLEQIKELAQQTDGSSLQLSLVILANNVKISLIMIGLGTFFSVFPIIGLTVNGMVIGYLFSTVNLAGGIPLWALIVFGILPHGILEIPAFVLAGAMGIKLGYMWIRPMLAKTRGESYLYAAKETLFLLPVILGLLLVAAAIEGFITPQLLTWYMK